LREKPRINLAQLFAVCRWRCFSSVICIWFEDIDEAVRAYNRRQRGESSAFILLKSPLDHFKVSMIRWHINSRHFREAKRADFLIRNANSEGKANFSIYNKTSKV
jgi:hypothetical protein